MDQVRSQPKVAGYPDNWIIQDRIKEAPLCCKSLGELMQNFMERYPQYLQTHVFVFPKF